MNLSEAQEGKEYIVKGIATEDEELDAFLFSLGCYSGEPVTVISKRKGGCVVSLKDARYNMDTDLAQAILIQTGFAKRSVAEKRILQSGVLFLKE